MVLEKMRIESSSDRFQLVESQRGQGKHPFFPMYHLSILKAMEAFLHSLVLV
jgi:hypothetical protein